MIPTAVSCVEHPVVFVTLTALLTVLYFTASSDKEAFNSQYSYSVDLVQETQLSETIEADVNKRRKKSYAPTSHIDAEYVQPLDFTDEQYRSGLIF